MLQSLNSLANEWAAKEYEDDGTCAAVVASMVEQIDTMIEEEETNNPERYAKSHLEVWVYHYPKFQIE